MKNYQVTLNGKPIHVYDCTVSAIPFNRVWPGHQRPKNQTETAYFVTVDIEDTAEIGITVSEDFQDYEIRPLAYDMPRTRAGNTVSVTVDKPMQFTFEPDGYHNALHVFVNAKSTAPVGEDVIYYGKGQHHAGLIWLKSNQTLYLEEGAVVHGAIFAANAENIRICGRGILNSERFSRGEDHLSGSREIFDKLEADYPGEKISEKYGAGENSLVLYNCRNVTVEGIILQDAMCWTVNVRNHCKEILLDNIKIIGQWRYNSDGIDICASTNVVVRNCFVRSFDDCMVARAAVGALGTEDLTNILVENCVLWCDWGKSLEVWCGDTPCAIRNVTFKDNYLIRVSNIAISIATWNCSEDTLVENISYQNIYMDGDQEYMALELESAERTAYSYRSDFVPYAVLIGAANVGVSTGNQGYVLAEDVSRYNLLYRNVSMDNVRVSGKPLKAAVENWEGMLTVRNVSLENCDFELDEIKFPKEFLKHAAEFKSGRIDIAQLAQLCQISETMAEKCISVLHQ